MPVAKKRKTTKKTEDEGSPLQVYEFHGFLRSTTKAGQHIGACPFCDHDDHFYINKETGQFDCKSCGEKGNKYTFLQLTYETCFKGTNEKHWKAVAKERQDLPWQIYRDEGIAYDNLQKCYLFPIWDDKGSIVNLYKWSGKRGDNLYGTPTCKLHLIGKQAIEEHGPVYITEGHWDRLALKWLLEKELDGPFTVLAVPGASNFNEERDVKFLLDREVYVMFDNDDPGRKGQERTVEILHRHPLSSLRCIQWPESYKDGFDIEDLIAEDISSPRKTLGKLKKFIHSVTQLTESEEEIEPIESFRKVVKEYKKHIHLSTELEDALALMFAVCFSVREESIPLWMFFVGSPGCIAGSETVTINRGGKSFQISIADLYHKYHGGTSNGGYGERKWRDDIPTTIQCRDEETGCIRLGTITDVIDSGIKSVYRVTLVDGRTLLATKDHRFLTNKGWKRLKDITLQHKIYADVGQATNQPRKKKAYYPEIEGLIYHPNAGRLRAERYSVPTHRLVVEADMNGMFLEEFVEILREDKKKSRTLKFLSKSQLVHHKDEDSTNFTRSNLEICTVQEHCSQKHDFKHHVLYKTAPVTIKSIKSVGRKHTYDISVLHPHNFIANGMVVHNSGKTLLLQSIGQTHRTHFESSLGPKTLVSGQKGDYDPSLLPRLIGRTLVVKDWTELLTMPSQDQEQVISVLRGAFDGRYEKSYGNGMVRTYPGPNSPHRTCYFSLIAGVTHSIYKNDRSDYGERFLRFEIKADEVEDQIRRALSNVREKVYPEFSLRPIANAFLARKVDPENLPSMPKIMESRLVGLATIISFIRSRVERHQGRLIYRPVLETPTRLAMQLLRLSRFLAFVYGKSSVDDQCYRLVKKVALDTCYGWHRDAFLVLMEHDKKGIEFDQIVNLAKIEKTQAHRCLNDLLSLGAANRRRMSDLQRRKLGLYNKGNIPYLWSLSDRAKKSITQAKLKA